MLILKPLSIDWSVAGAKIPAVTFIAQAGLPARELAHMLDSLVRVSRRVEGNHFVIVSASGGTPRESCKSAVQCTSSNASRKRALLPDTQRLNRQMSSTKGVRSPAGFQPCPWSCPQPPIDADTQGKNHHARPAQNPLQPLR